MKPRLLLHPVTIIWFELLLSFLFIQFSPLLFDNYFGGIQLLSTKGFAWIIIFAVAFTFGAFTVSLASHRRLPHEHEPKLFLEVTYCFTKATYRLVLILAVIGLINALWRWYTSIQFVGGLQQAFTILFESGQTWRINYAIGMSHGFGIYMPSYSSPALILYAVSTYCLLWYFEYSGISAQDLRANIRSIRRILVVVIILGLTTSFLVSSLLLARLVILQTLLPAAAALIIVLNRFSTTPTMKGDFTRRHIAIIIVAIGTIGGLIYFQSNLRLTQQIKSTGLVSISYFATGVYAADNAIQYVRDFGLGQYTVSQFLYAMGLGNPMAEFDNVFGRSDFEYALLDSQAWNLWRVTWVDFGPFGIVYCWLLGVLSAFVYYRAWHRYSLTAVWWGSLLVGVWMINFHVFQVILIIFWWNVCLLLGIALYGKFQAGRRRHISESFLPVGNSKLPVSSKSVPSYSTKR